MADPRPEIVDDCVRWLAEDSKHHSSWVRKVDRWYKAYRGVYDDARQANDWRSDVHPRYLLQVVETLVSGLSDPNPRWKTKPRPKAAASVDIERLREGAKQLELLLAYQRETDGMILKQRQHRLQGLIAGLTVWKTYWRYEETVETVKRTETDYWTGESQEIETEERLAKRDDPCVDVVDVRDFIWPESAVSLEAAPRLHHRVWMTWEKLKELEAAGYYKNVDDLGKGKDQEQRETALGMASESPREQELHEADRTRGRISVVEHWIEYGKRVVTIANNDVLLSDRKNPFQHGGYPFVACSPIPELFRIPGVSIIEIVEDLQRMVWQLQRQSLDNLELINNVIILNPQDGLMEDRVFAPGEQWLVEAMDNSPQALELPTYPVDVAQSSIQSLKADIQGIPGASPALLGQTDQVEQTATEVSLMANLAQRRLAMQKQQFTVADTRVAEQWIELNRQFLTEPRWVAIVGKDGDEGWEMIEPEAFQHGDFAVQIEQMDESMIRQERLAEAQSRLQVALTAIGPAAAIGQPMNLKAYVDDVLEAAGVQDKDRYWSASPQPGGMQGPGGPPAPGGPPQGPPQGVTAPQATDMNAPSNEFSQSPEMMMARMLSQGGGPSNAG